eukprot:jgi/Bigna1/87465/estExt_fgenesh1_pg.C_200191
MSDTQNVPLDVQPRRMLSAPVGNSQQYERKSPTPLFQRQVSAPAATQKINIARNYNYLETKFEKKSKANRLVKLHRLLVELGYSPENTETILKEVKENTVEEVIERVLKNSESKTKASKENEKVGQNEELQKKRLAEFKASVALIAKRPGDSVEVEEIRNVLPELQRQISNESKTKPATTTASGNNSIQQEESKGLLSEEMVSCGICLCDLPKSSFQNVACNHNYCKDCYSRYLEVWIKDGKVINLTCPESNCSREISSDEIMRCVDEETAKKYEKFKRDKEVAASSDQRWCITPNCEGILRKKTGSRKGGVTHSLHDRQPVNYAKPRFAGIAGTLSIEAHHNVKKCPQCRADIEKNSGCNHMTCYQCKYEFCWICGGKYTSNHFAPYNIFGCANLQDGECACFGDDNLCCVPCGYLTCECDCGDKFCRFNPVGFTKRMITRVVCFALMVPCCPCLTLLVMEDECCD